MVNLLWDVIRSSVLDRAELWENRSCIRLQWEARLRFGAASQSWVIAAGNCFCRRIISVERRRFCSGHIADDELRSARLRKIGSFCIIRSMPRSGWVSATWEFPRPLCPSKSKLNQIPIGTDILVVGGLQLDMCGSNLERLAAVQPLTLRKLTSAAVPRRMWTAEPLIWPFRSMQLIGAKCAAVGAIKVTLFSVLRFFFEFLFLWAMFFSNSACSSYWQTFGRKCSCDRLTCNHDTSCWGNSALVHCDPPRRKQNEGESYARFFLVATALLTV